MDIVKVNFTCSRCGKKNSLIEFGLSEGIASSSIRCEYCNNENCSIDFFEGFVYILSNPAFPNLVKIGFSKRDVEGRVKELNSSTSLPLPFQIEAIFLSENPEFDENDIHNEFQEFRVNQQREFFKLSIEEATDRVTKFLDQNPYFISKYLYNLFEKRNKEKTESQKSNTTSDPSEKSTDINIEKQKYCPTCQKIIPEPIFERSPSKYAIYWRDNKCSICDDDLMIIEKNKGAK